MAGFFLYRFFTDPAKGSPHPSLHFGTSRGVFKAALDQKLCGAVGKRPMAARGRERKGRRRGRAAVHGAALQQSAHESGGATPRGVGLFFPPGRSAGPMPHPVTLEEREELSSPLRRCAPSERVRLQARPAPRSLDLMPCIIYSKADPQGFQRTGHFRLWRTLCPSIIPTKTPKHGSNHAGKKVFSTRNRMRAR